MKWCYGFIKEDDRLILSEIYFDDNNEIQGACDNFGEDEQLDFDLIKEDLDSLDRVFEFDEKSEKWVTHYIKELKNGNL